MAYSEKIREEELKNKVGIDFFSAFDWSQIPGGIDFAVAPKSGTTRKLWDDVEFFLWAEAKAGKKKKIQESFVQLIFTIGKERTHEKLLPPAFLGAFDAEKIAFVPYLSVAEVFSQTDFNWNVAPSNHNTKEFKQLSKLVADTLKDESTLFRFGKDDRELRDFIKKNFREGVKEPGKIQITKNNFISIYQKWHSAVAPTIGVDWKATKKKLGLIDADFYLADLLSQDNFTLKEKLRVLLKSNYYKLPEERSDFGALKYFEVHFKDEARAHRSFWKRYVRPPKKEYWSFIIDRRDLLVPQDIREYKGAYFTPQIWVEKSQEYLADVLGENWQDEYVIWDCCAGTGNMLNGLTNVYNIFASTLDPSDVRIMQDRAANGANLLEEHIFQFDFLNDNLLDDESTGEESKLPKALQDIIRDPEKRKKLVIYINPPYAEATSATTVTGTGENKDKVATAHAMHEKYKKDIKKASNELFALFFIRIYKEIPGTVLAEFSTLKALQSPNFSDFRDVFKAKLCQLFLVPANTFDNVKGQFPIGFFVWDTAKEKVFKKITADVYDKNGDSIGKKTLYTPRETSTINEWLTSYKGDSHSNKGVLFYRGADFQNQKYVYIGQGESVAHDSRMYFNQNNLIAGCIYLAVRQCIDTNWLNNRDQFFAPHDSWQNDTEFHSDCLAFTLFHGQNKISIEEDGENHWIPFTEKEVGARRRFSSRFVADFIAGKLSKKKAKNPPLFRLDDFYDGTTPVKFSKEARAVFDAGREIWKYYHSQYGAAVDASLYDIKMHFQGVNDDTGRMNPKSDDEHYTELITELRKRLKILAAKIEPKVYEHGFLLK